MMGLKKYVSPHVCHPICLFRFPIVFKMVFRQPDNPFSRREMPRTLETPFRPADGIKTFIDAARKFASGASVDSARKLH